MILGNAGDIGILLMDITLFERLLDAARTKRRERRDQLQLHRLLGGAKAAPDAAQADRVDVRGVRALTGLSQAKFAELLGIETATLRNWEQGRRDPTGPGRALLRAIQNDPIGVIKALSD